MDLTEDEIKLIVSNVANNSDGFKFIQILLEKLGAFERGCKFDNTNMEYYNRGKREQGLWLLDLLGNSNINKLTEIEKLRRRNLCQKTNKQQD